MIRQDAAGSTDYTYSVLGGINTETPTFGTQSYTTAYVYDQGWSGNLIFLTRRLGERQSDDPLAHLGSERRDARGTGLVAHEPVHAVAGEALLPAPDGGLALAVPVHDRDRIAPGVAQRSGVTFGRGSFIVSQINKSSLPVAVNLVSNASARAIERVVASLEQPKIRRSKELFEKKLRSAFGDTVSFDLEFPGATGRKWQFNAGVTEGGSVVRLFELVSPSTQSVALANLKISDTQALVLPPRITAALSDYDATDPTLRAILSASGGIVISANDDISKYKLSAA